MTVTQRRVGSTGLTLAVREYADRPAGPHVVLVHGYPDDQRLWRPVAERLTDAGMHVVTYDVRGAGDSDVPEDVSGYRTELLVDDLVAVLDATVPEGEPVHLVGHDWGSVQLWEAVLASADDERLAGRIASFTSVSGPALEHMSHLVLHARRRPLQVLRQLGHSWYVGAFQLPVLPELAWRAAASVTGKVHGKNAANGLNLYRANVLSKVRRGAPRRTDAPVQVVLPKKDPFLTDVILEDLDVVCSDVRVVRPETGHWLPREDPDLMAELVVGHVRATTGATEA